MAVFLFVLNSHVTAEVAVPRLEQACAAIDLHIVTLIERHGITGTSNAERLAEATFLMLSARSACQRGDFQEAFKIYGSIPLERVHPALVEHAWIWR